MGKKGASFIHGISWRSVNALLSERIIITFNYNFFLIFVASVYGKRIFADCSEIFSFKAYNDMRIFFMSNILYG